MGGEGAFGVVFIGRVSPGLFGSDLKVLGGFFFLLRWAVAGLVQMHI